MERFQVAKKIEETIELLEKGSAEKLREAAERKARALAMYDKAVAVVIIKLRNGQPMVLDGQQIENPPVSIIEKIAKGLCWQEKMAAEEADAKYRNSVQWHETQRACLNGWQSIHKYFDNV
jgi:hypothetical protein